MDRFTRGFIIGAATSGIKDIITWVDYLYFHFTGDTYAHFMGLLLFDRRPVTISELILAQTVEVMFEGFIGIVFIYFAYRTHNKRNLWFKGIFFANAVYVSTFSLSAFFRLPLTRTVGTNVSTLITSTIFGVLMGLGVYWWGKRIGDWDEEVTISPKPRFSPEPARKRDQK